MTAPFRLVMCDDTPAMTPKERRKLRRCTPVPSGHALPPGTGPEGEMCGSCKHLYRKEMASTYLKCELARAKWTGGRKSDVRAGDAARAKWEPA
jgi:hypothetical protein